MRVFIVSWFISIQDSVQQRFFYNNKYSVILDNHIFRYSNTERKKYKTIFNNIVSKIGQHQAEKFLVKIPYQNFCFYCFYICISMNSKIHS
jgi:hypothetical protein